MEIKRLTNTKRIKILIALTLIALLVLPFAITKVLNISTEVGENKIRLQKEQSDLAALDDLLNVKNSHSEKIELITKSLPSTYREVAGYTIELEDITRLNNQVLDTTIDKSTVPEEPGLASLNYTIKTEGGFTTYYGFLNSLSHLPYHTKIDSIKLDESEGTTNTITSYRIFLHNEETIPLASEEIPVLDTTKIDALYKLLSEERLKGGDN